MSPEDNSGGFSILRKMIRICCASGNFRRFVKEQCGLSLKKETIQQKIDFSRKAVKYLRISSASRTGVSRQEIYFKQKALENLRRRIFMI